MENLEKKYNDAILPQKTEKINAKIAQCAFLNLPNP